MSFRSSLVKSVYKLGRLTVDHLPEILMVGGGVLTTLGFIKGGKSAVKCKELKDEYEQKLQIIDNIVKQNEEAGTPENYPEEEMEKDLKVARREYRWGCIKAYSTSVPLMIGGFACFGGAFGIVSVRYSRLASSYFIKAQEMVQLEKAVAAKYGTDVLEKLKNGEDPDAPEKQVDEEGNEIPNTSAEDGAPRKIPVDGYAFLFDEGCNNVYSKEAEENRRFLWNMQNVLTNQLVSKGILFYNDLLEACGKERVQDGYEVGWVYIKDPILQKRLGVSNYVDLGIWDRSINGATARFRKGYERSVLIRPNLDPIPIRKYSGWAKSGRVPILGADGKIERY